MTAVIIPVLLYHSVTDGPALGGSWGAVSRRQFEGHIEQIVTSKRHSVTISTLASMLRGERPLVERPVAVTFDDGYGDTYQAVQDLCRHGLCSTVYVTTDQIGREQWLSAQQIAALAEFPGAEVGAHGVRHDPLDELNAAELQDELEGSKRRLERLTSRSVQSFAYPHGAYDRRVRAAVIEAGYRSAVAVKNAASHAGDDVFAIARFTVTATTPAHRIADILEGTGIPLAWTQERVRTRAYRIARRSRRRLIGTRRESC